MGGVFFSVGESFGRLSDLIGKLNALTNQFLEMFVIINVLLDLRSFVSWDAAVKLLTVAEALQNEVRALGHKLLTLLFLVDLAAESAASQAVDRSKLNEERLALGG
jgi:hypothetical protein